MKVSAHKRHYYFFVCAIVILWFGINFVLYKDNIISNARYIFINAAVILLVMMFTYLLIQRALYKQVRIIQKGLYNLEHDPEYRIHGVEGPLKRIAWGINDLADNLINTRNLMAQVVNSMPVSVVTVNRYGQVIVCNQTAKSQFGCKEDCGNITNRVRNCPGQLLQWTINSEKPITDYDYFMELLNSEQNKLLINTELIKGSYGECAGGILTALDITERQIMLEQMQQADKMSMISELAAGVAHEIKNPLTSARGLLQLLDTRLKEDITARQHIKVALESMDRINVIIKELVLLSQPSKPDLTFSQLENVLDEISVLIDSEAICNNVNVERIYQSNLPLAVMDVNQIKQVFINIASNAIHAMPKGGKLTISVGYRPDNNEFIISFKDNGIGITEQDIKNIFNPFYTTKEYSTGLGLTVSYQLIKYHGGRIKVKSKLNMGTVVTVFLPVLNQSKKIS